MVRIEGRPIDWAKHWDKIAKQAQSGQHTHPMANPLLEALEAMGQLKPDFTIPHRDSVK